MVNLASRVPVSYQARNGGSRDKAGNKVRRARGGWGTGISGKYCHRPVFFLSRVQSAKSKITNPFTFTRKPWDKPEGRRGVDQIPR